MEKREYRDHDLVRYHPVIGKPEYLGPFRITMLGKLGDGQEVAWLSRKSGCVSLDALEPEPCRTCSGEGGWLMAVASFGDEHKDSMWCKCRACGGSGREP
jgi:hypothetical protein